MPQAKAKPCRSQGCVGLSLVGSQSLLSPGDVVPGQDVLCRFRLMPCCSPEPALLLNDGHSHVQYIT